MRQLLDCGAAAPPFHRTPETHGILDVESTLPKKAAPQRTHSKRGRPPRTSNQNWSYAPSPRAASSLGRDNASILVRENVSVIPNLYTFPAEQRRKNSHEPILPTENTGKRKNVSMLPGANALTFPDQDILQAENGIGNLYEAIRPAEQGLKKPSEAVLPAENSSARLAMPLLPPANEPENAHKAILPGAKDLVARQTPVQSRW